MQPGSGYYPQQAPPPGQPGYPPQGAPPPGAYGQPPPQGYGAPPPGYPPQPGQPGSFQQPSYGAYPGQPGAPPAGYPPAGSGYYAPQGAPPPQGYPPQGYPPQGAPPPAGYPPQGYPPQGYPPQGYPPQGYPPQGFPPPGAMPAVAVAAPGVTVVPGAPMMAAGAPTLRLRVIRAFHLSPADPNGKSDPYAIIRWEGQPRPYTKQEGKMDAKMTKAQKKNKVARPQTSVMKRTLDPQWNQNFDIVIPAPVVQPSDILTLELFDFDAAGAHDFLGSVHVEMGGLNMGQERVCDLPVMTKRGTVQVGLTAINFAVPPTPATMTASVSNNKQIAAESARKRASYKKWKKAQTTGKHFVKDVGKGVKSFMKMF